MPAGCGRAPRGESPRARRAVRKRRAPRADRRPATPRGCCQSATDEPARSPHPIQPVPTDTSSAAPRARQQVRVGGLQPARARSQEHEAPASAFDRAMDFVEEGWDALDFIEHDDSMGRQRPQLQREQCGVGEQRLRPAFVEKIDDVRIGERLTRPGALSDPAHPVQEEAAFGRGQDPHIPSGCHDAVIIPCKITTWLQSSWREVSERGELSVWRGQTRALRVPANRLLTTGCFQ